MKVRHINKHGQIWDYDTVGKANCHLKKGWRERANIIKSSGYTWLEIVDDPAEEKERESIKYIESNILESLRTD